MSKGYVRSNKSKLIDIIIGILSFALLILTDVAVVTRKMGIPLIYTLELSKVLYAWAIWVTIYWVTKNNQHISMDFVKDWLFKKSKKWSVVLKKGVWIFNLLYFLIIAVYSTQYTYIYYKRGVYFLAMPNVPYFIFPLAMVFGCIPCIIWMLKNWKGNNQL